MTRIKKKPSEIGGTKIAINNKEDFKAPAPEDVRH